eukprot:8881753-Pyramimonas_sp.AAC.1
MRVAKTIQKGTTKLRDQPGPVPQLIPDGQFGPYGGLAPGAPPLREVQKELDDQEKDMQGVKRDAEEAKLPEAPSRGGRVVPPGPHYLDEALWVQNVTRRASDWLNKAPDVDRRRFLDRVETLERTDSKLEAMLVQGQAQKEKVWAGWARRPRSTMRRRPHRSGRGKSTL